MTSLRKIKVKLRVWWNFFWLRKDEFHPSLNMDVEAMCFMTEKERKNYLKKLLEQRDTAHKKDLENEIIQF